MRPFPQRFGKVRSQFVAGLARHAATGQRGGQARPVNGNLGFTLLEVILTLAILAGAIAVIGEVSRLGLRNAQRARELTHAQLLCESKLAELVVGAEPLEAQQNVPLGTVADGSGDPDWLYSVEVNSTDQTGLVEVRVTVSKEPSTGSQPVSFSLVRWMLDPNATSTEESTSETSTTNAASGGANQ